MARLSQLWPSVECYQVSHTCSDIIFKDIWMPFKVFFHHMQEITILRYRGYKVIQFEIWTLPLFDINKWKKAILTFTLKWSSARSLLSFILVTSLAKELLWCCWVCSVTNPSWYYNIYLMIYYFDRAWYSSFCCLFSYHWTCSDHNSTIYIHGSQTVAFFNMKWITYCASQRFFIIALFLVLMEKKKKSRPQGDSNTMQGYSYRIFSLLFISLFIH